jgi:hypothetical protein
MSPQPPERLNARSVSAPSGGFRPGGTDGGSGCGVLPAAMGQGAPLFTELAHPVILQLIKATLFPSGILELCYTPAGHRPAGASPGQIG